MNNERMLDEFKHFLLEKFHDNPFTAMDALGVSRAKQGELVDEFKADGMKKNLEAEQFHYVAKMSYTNWSGNESPVLGDG